MIEIDGWLRELDEEPGTGIINRKECQEALFLEYVSRSGNCMEKRKAL